MKAVEKNHIATITIVCCIILAIILVAETIWMGHSAKKNTEKAVRAVSLLYLSELAGRREKVVETYFQRRIREAQTAITLIKDHILNDESHLKDYQSRMKYTYGLEKFAFVDTEGLVYTSEEIKKYTNDFNIDYKKLSTPQIYILNLGSANKKVIIALPVDVKFNEKSFCVCFIQIDMEEMLSVVSITTNDAEATFCNIYAQNGTALTNAVLGGLAEEDNLLLAMKNAQFEAPYSYENFIREFQHGKRGVVSFTYNNIRETLAYIPVNGTDWQLTYLIRESVISDRVSSVYVDIIHKSIIQSILTIAVMLVLFFFIITQIKKNNHLLLEKETTETANRIKQIELEQRLALQEKLLREEQRRDQQNKMITALSSDYWSVYYVELDKDEGICYQEHGDLDNKGLKIGKRFKYLESVTAYANTYVTEPYREEFLRFVHPDTVRKNLKNTRIISYTYTVFRHGKEYYETVRFAGVRHPEDRDDHIVHSVGACFADTDAETRKAMAQSQVLGEALKVVKEANKAKTAFLSNMSHEIRTPMNAIIGLDNIALNDPETPPKTKEYLEKIGTSAEHLLNLINDILDMARIESGRLILRKEEFSFSNLLQTINTIFSSQCNDKGLDYQCHINGEVDDYYIGDNMKLRQVLINILSNAVKFSSTGGKVELQVERKAKYDGQSTLQFTISDTGIGMSEDFIPYIFDAFSQEDSSTTNKYGSSGLGMAITKNIVELMNGNIQVKSVKGKGSTFSVTVTLANATRDDSLDNSTEIHPNEMVVLVVDDDPIDCEHAKLVLEKAGIAAEIATSGQEAIEMTKLRHARREPYNLILVDWQMPNMDGVETTRQIRAIVGDESAIIILTAYKWDDILDQAVQAGVDSFIAKPLFAVSVLEEFKSASQRKKLFAKQKENKADLKGRKILLAEDMQVNAEIMIMVLQMRQMEVDLAENGKIAVDKFANHPEHYYDAILMDMRMPEMDGLEATRTIRAMDRADAQDIPIIALTANAFDEDVQRSLQAGLNAHLSKPVQPEALFETLESFIKE
ncbi:response regulator [bacterium]|nr:response regulator [bacterium]